MEVINLKNISGLPVSLDVRKPDLIFGGDFPFTEKTERSLDNLRPYLKNPKAIGPDPAYYMWRRVHLEKDDEKFTAAGLRYDLTLLAPGKIGNEFVKTAGHNHRPPYPEIYEVLYGRAYFLIQSYADNDCKSVQEVFLTEAGAGEKFAIPSGFGHNMVNISDEPLLTANLVSDRVGHNYAPYNDNHGACYYILNGRRAIEIEKNPNYRSVPDIKKIRIREYPEFGLAKKIPLYDLINAPDKIDFLSRPENNLDKLGW